MSSADKKAEKKKAKLQERLKEMEANLALALQKKSSSASEIDVPGTTRAIATLRNELRLLGT